MSPVLIGVVLVAVAIALAFLATRARAAKNLVVRWLVTILAGLLAVGIGLVGVVDLLGVYRLSVAHGNPVSEVKVAATADQLARGEHLAYVCAVCHSSTGRLPLDGGRTSLLSSPGNSGLGTLYAPNLTPGGPLKDWSDGVIIRAIREGVDDQGHALIIMPSNQFHVLSDADAQALVAYLRSQPAVTRSTPNRDLNLIGTLLIGAGLFPTAVQAPITQPVTAPPSGVTAAYGEYLVAISACRSCHGADLTGGSANGGPVGPNLTAIVPRWTEAQFVQTIRTGTDPSGYSLRPDMMPWRQYSAAYSDDELKAMDAYLRALPPIQRAAQ